MLRYLLFSATLLILSCSNPSNENSDKASIEMKQYSIEEFYKNTRYGGGAFSPDEKKLLVHSDVSGIFNVYEIDIESGSMDQLTNSEEESYFAVDYVPSSGEVIYTHDKGGNEIDHLYLRKSDGSSVDLTPGEAEKASFGGWSEDDKYMYYTSNKRNPQFFDMYKMSVEDWSAEMIYENNDGINVSAMSNDEQYFALSKTITTTENELWILNKATGEKIFVSDADNPGSYGASGFSDDNKTFYYITDIGEEFAYLVAFDMESGEKRTIFSTNWDVMYAYLSENEKYRVIAINEDGKNTLKVFDVASGKEIAFPDIKDGNITSVNISDSEEQMRLFVGTSKAPSNIYVYNFSTKELKKLTESLNPNIDPNHLVSAEVVRYKSFDGLDIPAIYYKPLNASADNKVPALVLVHGGPGGQSRVGYWALNQYLVNHGYAVLAVNNRGSSGYGKTFFKMDNKNHGDKDLQDCIYGKKWLQEQPYIDSEKIGIIGGSYGGYMTMAAMTFTPDEFNVGVNIFGVTNWLRTLKSIPPYWESFRNALYEEIGNPYSEDSVRLYNISPLFHAENVKNPVMVLQGANDPRVLQVESDEIVAAVKNNNVPVEYVVFEDEGHGFIKKENEIQAYRQIREFLDTYLRREVTN